MNRVWSLAVGLLVVVLGAAGLVRGSVSQPAAGGTGDTGAAPIVVTGAYVHPPAPPTPEAAAYFTVYNTTAVPDELESVSSGAGALSVLHTLVDGVMTAVSGGVTIPAHGSLVLSVGSGHVMISELYGVLKPGQSVDLELQFLNAGPVEVVAPVIAFGAPVPGSVPGSGSATSSTGASK